MKEVPHLKTLVLANLKQFERFIQQTTRLCKNLKAGRVPQCRQGPLTLVILGSAKGRWVRKHFKTQRTIWRWIETGSPRDWQNPTALLKEPGTSLVFRGTVSARVSIIPAAQQLFHRCELSCYFCDFWSVAQSPVSIWQSEAYKYKVKFYEQDLCGYNPVLPRGVACLLVGRHTFPL